MLEPAFTAAYLALGLALVAVEVVGIRRKGKGDTISDHVWWLRRRFAPTAYIIGGFLVWAIVHFGFEG